MGISHQPFQTSCIVMIAAHSFNQVELQLTPLSWVRLNMLQIKGMLQPNKFRVALKNCAFDRSRYASSVTATTINSIDNDRTKNLTVAIVGRPNTGKSTLFNRLTQTKMAIVSNVPGTTRDRREGQGYLAGIPLNLIDTGGLDDRGAVSKSIQTQVEKAFLQSDVILFMLDGKHGVTALDQYFAKWIRKTLGTVNKRLALEGAQQGTDPNLLRKKVILVANKTEGAHMSNPVMDTVAEALSLGFGEPQLISATHGDGIADLAPELLKVAQEKGKAEITLTKTDKRRLNKEAAAVAAAAAEEEGGASKVGLSAKIPLADRIIQLAIMGRPNVGKSTLLNAFIQEERAITGPMAGLTRDAIHAEWSHNERLFRLVDTAGLTRLRTNKQLLEGVKEKRRTAEVEKTGMLLSAAESDSAAVAAAASGGSAAARNYVDSAVKLPGRDLANPELDPSQYSYQISEFSLISALNALRFAQVVLIVVEGTQGRFSKVDLQLARKCLEEGRGLVIAANKADIMERGGVNATKYEDGVKEHIAEFMREFGEVPIVVSSGTKQQGVDRILNTVIKVHDAWSRRIDTGSLNNWMRDLMVTQPPPRVDGKALNLKYMTQVKARPPTFALFTNMKEIPIFFERFLKSNIQKSFGLEGVPVRFVIRKTSGLDVHRSKGAVGAGGAPVKARSAKSPLGVGGWKKMGSKNNTGKKGLVGPNRDRKRMRARMAKTLLYRKKSAVAGRGVVHSAFTENKLRTSKRTPTTSSSSSSRSDGAAPASSRPRQPAAAAKTSSGKSGVRSGPGAGKNGGKGRTIRTKLKVKQGPKSDSKSGKGASMRRGGKGIKKTRSAGRNGAKSTRRR
jgi:predicted GTPase